MHRRMRWWPPSPWRAVGSGPWLSVAIGDLSLDDGGCEGAFAGVVGWLHQSEPSGEDQELIAGQIACGRCSKNVGKTLLQGPAFGRDRRGRESIDLVCQGKDPLEPEVKPGWQHIVTCLVDIGDIQGEMGETGLMRHRVPLLRRMAIGTPDLRPMAFHHLAHHDGAAGRCGTMDNRLA